MITGVVPSFVSYWKNCLSSAASHLGFMSAVWCMISGGEPVQWGAIKDPSALIWSHPKWFIKWYWWPKEVLERKPKPQAFPPSVPTSHSHFGDEKERKSSCWRHASVAFPTSFSPCVLKSCYNTLWKVTASHRHISNQHKSQRSV